MTSTKPTLNKNSLTSRAALLAACAILFLAVFLILAGPSAGIAAYHLYVDGGAVLLWLVSAAGWGWMLWQWMRCPQTHPVLKIITCITLGLGLLSLLALMLAWAGLLTHVSSIVLIAVGVIIAAIVAAFRLRDKNILDALSAPARWSWLWLAVMPLLAMVSLAAFFPAGIIARDEPNSYDVMEYHLQVPREWYEAGRMFPMHYNVFSYFPMNGEMHYLLAMHLRGGAAGPWTGMFLAQLMNVAFTALLIVAVHALAGGGRRGIIAGAITAGVPWLAVLAPIAYVEPLMLLFAALAIGWALRGQSAREFILAGLFAGFACGTKLSIAPLLLIGLPLLLILTRKKWAWLYVLAALLSLSPWLIRNTIWTHNPVFPEAMSILGKAHFSDIQVQRWHDANFLPDAAHRSVAGRFDALWTQVITDWKYGRIFVPLAVIAAVLAGADGLPLVLLLAFQTVFWVFFTHVQGRFMTPMIPIVALLIGRHRENKFLPAVAASLAVLLIAGSTWKFHDWIDSAVKLSRTEPLLGNDGGFAFLLVGDNQWMPQSQLPSGTPIDFVGDAQIFYFHMPMQQLHYKTVFDVDTSDHRNIILDWLDGMPSPAQAIPSIDYSELDRFSKTYDGIPPPMLAPPPAKKQ